MVFFTTPELLEIGGLPLVSPFEKPTRIEALRYYRRVVDTYELAIEFGEQVVSARRAATRRAGRGRLRDRDALGQRRAADSAQPQRDLRDRLFRSSELHRRARRESAARVALLQRVARLLPKERRHRRRRQLGGRDGARAVPLGRERHARASPSAVEAEHQILGAARHREPHQGRIGQRAVQHEGRGDPADAGRSSSATARRKRFRPMPSSC